ncbi:MAG: right-handed parallel beta-helix repeat-containing protein [Promethearchaeota archaeon]
MISKKKHIGYNLNKITEISIFVLLIILSVSFIGAFQWNVSNDPYLGEQSGNELDTLRSSVPHAPILINNNTDLENQFGSTGDGLSWETAYIIEDYEISLSGDQEYCIYVRNINKYLIIQNCTLTGVDDYCYGIHLKNCTKVMIFDNNIKDHEHSGIRLQGSRNNTILQNTIFNNGAGIYVQSSRNNTISLNNASNNYAGIYVTANSYNNTIIENTCNYNSQWGIILFDHPHHNKILENNIEHNNLGIYIHNNIYNNTIMKNKIKYNTLEGISGDVDIYDNEILYNDIISNGLGPGVQSGIDLYRNCDNTKIIGNFIAYNDGYGISMHGSSSELLIIDNKINHNGQYGILMKSHYNDIINNSCTYNGGFGVYVTGNNNDFYINTFRANNGTNPDNQIIDLGINNTWRFNMFGLDSDGDGLYDEEEMLLGTSPYLIDSDGDGFLDGYEDHYGSDPLDPDIYPAIPQEWYDSLIIYLEGNATLIKTVIGWLERNSTEILELFRYVEGNASLLFDTINYIDGNATLIQTVLAIAQQNEAYLNQINSTLTNDIETIQAVIDLLGISIGDTDYDGLNDLEEISYGTNPTMIDTDLDNLNDAFEIKYGTDPLDDDSDDDGSFDGIEVASGTNPLDPDDYPGKVTPSDGINIPLLVGTIIGVVGAVIVGILTGTFFYFKKRKIS